ncbi:hypothetical protein ACLOJK_006397 [Asimina triloba]
MGNENYQSYTNARCLVFLEKAIRLRLGKQREEVYKRDIQQQEEGKGLNRGTPEHLVISDVSISMERVTHDFDESVLRTEEDSVNTPSKSSLSDSIVEESTAVFSA